MSLIPWPYRWLALALAAAALIGFGWIKGAGHVQAQWDAVVQQQTLQAAAARERQAQATVKVVTKYVNRVRVVREKGDTIIKEVPVYVPTQADAACTVNRGFVRLHDAAAAGELPTPAGDSDAAASGLALSTVAGTVTANYQTCHENAEQLRALQMLVGEMTQDNIDPKSNNLNGGLKPEVQHPNRVSCTHGNTLQAIAARRARHAGVAAPAGLESKRHSCPDEAQPQHHQP